MDGGISDSSGYKFPQYYVPSASGRTPSENNLRNISIRTGEEFSMEFVQDRATPGGIPVRRGLDHGYVKRMGFNVQPNLPRGYEDQIGTFGLRRVESDFSCDVSSACFPRENAVGVNIWDVVDGKVVTEQRFYDNPLDDCHDCSFLEPLPAYPSSSHVPRSSESPHAGKVKFLCSFGGKILPRPGDGKLRYVGGETRMICVKSDLSWKELLLRSASICSPPHIIKYQLPGEDLDALISVSSNEDFQNMMDEYYGLEKADGSQRLRLFLIPLNETENCSVDTRGLQNSSEYQYFFAVNNMVDPSPKKSSSGNSLSSQVGCLLDRLPSFQKDPPLLPVDTVDGTGIYHQHPNSQLPVSFQVAPSPPTYSPPFSPKLVLPCDSRISRKHSLDGHFTEDQTSDNCYDIDRGCLMAMRFHPNMHGEADTTIKQSGSQFQSQKCDREFPPPSYNYSDSELAGHFFCEKHFLTENDAHSVKFSKQQEDSVSWITGSSDSAGPIHGMPHAFSDSLLRDQGEISISGNWGSNGSRVNCKTTAGPQSSCQSNMLDGAPGYQITVNHTDVPFKLQRTAFTGSHIRPEFSPSNNHPESYERNQATQDDVHNIGSEYQIKETNNRNYGDQDYQQKHGFGSYVSDWMHDKGNLVSQEMNLRPDNSAVASHDASELQDSVHYLSNIHGTGIPSPDFDIVEGSLPTSLLFSPSIHVDKINDCFLANQFNETKTKVHQDLHFHDDSHQMMLPPSSGPMDSAQVKMPKSSAEMKDENVESFGNKTSSTDASLKFPTTVISQCSNNKIGQDAAAMINKDPCTSQNSQKNYVSQKLVSLIDEDLVSYCDLDARNRSHGNCGDEMATVEHAEPLPNKRGNDTMLREALVTVEDVTDGVPPGVPVAPTQIPHVLEDDNEEAGGNITSSQMAAENQSHTESECEYVKDDERDMDGSISDAAIAEIEAGIYGLQPILVDCDTIYAKKNYSIVNIIKNADLEELRELGSGTFGTVYHGKWRGTDVAIKRIKKSCFAGRSSEQDRLTKDFWREAQILSKLHHPNVVAFYGVVPDGAGGTLTTVTEFMVGDFGLSRIKRNTLVSGGVRGTLPWMAPELLNGSSNRVSEKLPA
ncbi:Serine/threonine-protein kinase EDR1 [Apostasia shenzhenica]|uniref:Serine/threonine-protein kinase EDR1 n=1 Tax=Apostasia shenzhenica TaxID=1088818 RepID=A0A2I0AT99_9ASPA|nr:Serine/threonine-protein kinase EDR1 [Apostasia shenzhenica]